MSDIVFNSRVDVDVIIKDLLPTIKEVLSDGGYFRIRGGGWSMLPFIRDSDEVILTSIKTDKLRVGDILLYKRKNSQYVIHRLFSKDDGEGYSFIGDNQSTIEKGITREQLLFYIVAVVRDKRIIYCEKGGYRFVMTLYMYARVYCPVIAYRIMLPFINVILR